ncbi:AMP-binding protein [Campylobacter showae]|uniref:Acyl-CoA synthetase, AMP-(Fatty) acid ligase / (3R)-hydroxymyristoyl-(ACP) dehydratase n=1 Tax=Campylobacter showae CSUNSWCD TaxID=1244083 RepID=M5INS7_9BACT|nr:AMP-binding protein [Campylobacter showae]EKU10186.1 Acyl-CoA synthetase, AMP-(fatty) acid ligase / (3R)-hydroxymyristoyl-(ACP) dehydratase [Campylobacter showae CSUNSWCD]
MSFEENLKNFRFTDDSRDVFDACLRFAAFLEKGGVKELQIYIDDAFKFYAAFFGSLLAGTAPCVLAKPIYEANLTAVNDENFLNFLANEPAKGLKFDPQAKFYLQTSGSSGKSKMIEKSLAQMIKESEYLADELNFSSQNTFFSSVSHRHMFGLTFKVFLPLALGARVIADELNYPEAILGLSLANHVFIASPVLLRTLAQSPAAIALKGLSGIVSAGSPLKKELRSELGRICDARIIEIYGSTETGIVAKDDGCGLRLFDAVDAGLDDRGALSVSSPWCEFFQTNDAASIDEDRLALQGRIDRIVKLNDKRVSLESIEAKLLESGLLADCYCAPHPKFKRIAALLQLNGEGLKKFRKIGKKGVVAELKELLKLEFKNSVRYFKIVEKMPRNQQGKFEKSEFENALFASPKPVWSGGRVNEAGKICYGSGQNLESALNCDTNASCVKFDEGGDRLDGAQKYEFGAIMHAGLEIFESHFPNLPLLPGFMQLDYVFELASMVGVDISGASTVENLKFMKFVRPGDLLRIYFEKRGGKLYFELFCNGKKCSTGRATL